MIRLIDVDKTYGDGVNFQALDGICLDVQDHEFVSITGPSGSGKTTLLNLIGTLDKPTGGQIFYDDTDVTSLNGNQLADYRRNVVGFVFQSYNLLPQLTALENVMYPLIPYKKQDQNRAHARELLQKMGLEDKTNQLPDQLSGGEQQRVAIARALTNHPRVILADEPTGNLDSASGAKVMEILLELHRCEGITVVLVTHDERLASMADRTVHLADGRIVSVQ